MIGASGIGTCISQWLPRLIAARPEFVFALLGPARLLADFPWTGARNVRVIDVDAPIYSVREQIALHRQIPKDTTVVWSPHYNIPLTWRGRLAVTVHDLSHLALPEFVHGAHRRAYAWFMFHSIARGADAIMTDSDFTRAEFERLVGSARAEPEVVHLGVDREWFEVPPSPSPHPRPYLLFVGNVKPLLIVGKKEGFLTGDTAVQAAAERLSPRVRLLGAVPQDLLKRYVSHAQALVLPSLYEGFGLPPLEAMACGRPVIVSRAASLPEICGDAAVYCDPLDPTSIAEAITLVLEDTILQQQLRFRGLERAGRFTWDRSAQSVLAVLEGMLPS
jgi:glycosyltransferase involved in cell wall biosynthesis